MTLICLIAALVIEQIRPLPYRNWIEHPVNLTLDWLEARLNAGGYRQGAIAWTLAVLLPALLIFAIDFLLSRFSPTLAFFFYIGILYLTLGFRQFSHFYSEIELALRAEDIPRARELLANWREVSGPGLSSEEIARLSLEQGFIASYRHVFAVLVAFIALGPAAAVLYRLSVLAALRWGRSHHAAQSNFTGFAQHVLKIFDWIPARVTGFVFAVVGDFEDAFYCWRSQAAAWPNHEEGIIIAAGAGALGVRLGMPVSENGNGINDRPELGLGEEADADIMQSASAMAWRAMVLWLLLLLLFSLAPLQGG